MSSFVKVNGKGHIGRRLAETQQEGAVLKRLLPWADPGKRVEQYLLEREEHNRRYLPPFQDTIPFWARAGALELFFERDVGCGFVAGLGEFPLVRDRWSLYLPRTARNAHAGMWERQ